MGRARQLIVLAMLLFIGQLAVSAAKGANYGVKLSAWEEEVPVQNGLAWGYYMRSCSRFERIVRGKVAKYIKRDPGVAAGLLRLFFHDCFVQGCDASILLRLSSGTELDDAPNLTIRSSALDLIDEIKAKLECTCPGRVSCADVVVMASKVAVQKVGGPPFHVPLGRRDSLSFSPSTTDLPNPFSPFAEQKSLFNRKGLDTADLVALSGAHTLGIAFCPVFTDRLYPSVDPRLNQDYAKYLISNVCPTNTSNNATGLDFYSPNRFDNQYFANLPTGGALLCSDQNLDQDSTAWGLVNNYAGNQRHFFNQFRKSFVKMSQIQILTRGSGEIRKVCCTTNSELGSVNSTSTKLACLNDEDDEPDIDDHELVSPVDPSDSETYLSSVATGGRTDSS